MRREVGVVKIAVVVEYLRAQPWASGRWACAVASGLARRGHDVAVLCDGTERTGLFAPARVVQRRPTRRHTQRQPLRFAAWARAQLGSGGFDATISFARTVPAEHWLPVGPRVVDEFDGIFAGRSPASLALALSHQLWIPQAWIAERRARGDSLSRCVTDFGHASTLERDDDAALERRRLRVRAALRIQGRVVAMSVTEPVEREIAPVLASLNACDATAIVAGRRAHTIARWARAQGSAARVVSVGPTERMADVLAAADAAVVPSQRTGTARFATDALRVGRPVVSAHKHGWAEAIARVCDDPAAHAEARERGASLGMDSWLDRFERDALGIDPADTAAGQSSPPSVIGPSVPAVRSM